MTALKIRREEGAGQPRCQISLERENQRKIASRGCRHRCSFANEWRPILIRPTGPHDDFRTPEIRSAQAKNAYEAPDHAG
jgi:hypothetical protein